MSTISYYFKAKTLIKQGRIKQSAINEIKNWIPPEELPELCDEFIVLILLACRNVIEDTKKTIILYFKYKKNGPEIFENRNLDSDELQQNLTVVTSAEIPVRTEDNNAILIFRLKDTNYFRYNIAPSFKMAFMVAERCQLSNPPDGVIVCIDMAGVGLMHLTRLKLGLIQKLIQFLEEAISCKLVTFYFLNANYVFEKLFKLIKVFLNDELVKIVRPVPVGTSLEGLDENRISAKCLPEEYGGILPNLEQLAEKTTEDLIKEKEYFVLEEKWRKSVY